jgi:hypothetical protein
LALVAPVATAQHPQRQAAKAAIASFPALLRRAVEAAEPEIRPAVRAVRAVVVVAETNREARPLLQGKATRVALVDRDQVHQPQLLAAVAARVR